MTEKEIVVWGIHAGRTGDAHSLFVKHDVVAIGWNEMSDLSTISPTREAIRAVVVNSNPDSVIDSLMLNTSKGELSING